MAEEASAGSGVASVPTPRVERAMSPQLTPLRETLRKMSYEEKISFLQTLPPEKQAEAIKSFGLEIKGGSGEDLQEMFKEGIIKKSRFEQAKEDSGTLLQIDRSKLKTPDLQVKFDSLLKANTEEIKDLIKEAEADGVLTFVLDDIRRIYTTATTKTPPTSDWYNQPPEKSLEDRIKEIREALGNYEETFWGYGEATLKEKFKKDDIKALKQDYKGVASYLAAKVAIAIEKELTGRSLIDEEIGDRFLLKVEKDIEETKGEREKERREKRKRATAEERLHYSDWREKFDFNWAETAEELDDSVEDWLDYFQQGLPLEAEEGVHQEVQKGLNNALSSLEKARNRIGLEARSVVVQALREKIVGHVTTIGGARLLESRGGFEYFIKLRADFAANYNGYYDRIYKKEDFAIMAYQLSKNGGAIYKGGPEYLNKPLAGDTKTFRGDLERDAIKYGTTHELYITEEDIKVAKAATGADLIRIRDEVVAVSLSEEEARDRYNREVQKFNRRYSWGEDDLIEELLLEDKRGLARAQAISPDPNNPDRKEAEERRKRRINVFNGIKETLDKEDGLFGKTDDERKNIIRQRIRDKIMKEGNTVLLQDINSLSDQAAQDRALWKWVRDYNKPRLEFRQEGSSDEPWFPSLWDMERLSINTSEDLIDRALSKDKFEAMVEEIDDPYKGLTEEQIRRKATADTWKENVWREFETKVRREVMAEMNALEEKGRDFAPPPGEARRHYEEKMKPALKAINEKIEDVLFKRKQKETRAIRNYNLNVAQDKFLGLQARWGGLTTRVVNENGEVELRTIYSLAEEIIKSKIDKEAAEIKAKVNVWKPGYIAANPGITAEQLEEATIKQERLFRRNATFAATLGLRELGIGNDLPIWNYSYYGDVSQIGAFAPLIGYTDDEKAELVEVLDRGRREMEAVFSFLADIHMDGRILVVKDSPRLVIEDKNGVQKEAHEESRVRPRVINEGGVLKLRDLFEANFMISTSGGVKVPNLIAKIARLGVYDELWENGCKDKREWQGFRKRRNRWELRQQSFYNIREWADPITYVQRLAGASVARKFLVGGEVQGQGSQPGVLNETMKGAWRMRRALLESNRWLAREVLDILGRTKTVSSVEELKKELQVILEQKGRTKDLSTIGRDELVEVGGDIIKFLRDYLSARAYVRNKAGYAPKNWHYDNELITQAYFEELARREPTVALPRQKLGMTKDGKEVIAEGGEALSVVEGEALGDQGQAFAPQGRSQVAREIYEGLLRGSTYEIPDKHDRTALEIQAYQAKERLDVKRKELLGKILPAVQQAVINGIREKLVQQDKTLEVVKKSFAELFTDRNKLDEQKINQHRVELKNQTKVRETLELAVNKKFNQEVEAELDRQISGGDLTYQLLRKQIAGRRQQLEDLNTSELNTEWEINRLINYYIDTQLHKEVVGEWGAKLST